MATSRSSPSPSSAARTASAASSSLVTQAAAAGAGERGAVDERAQPREHLRDGGRLGVAHSLLLLPVRVQARAHRREIAAEEGGAALARVGDERVDVGHDRWVGQYQRRASWSRLRAASR